MPSWRRGCRGVPADRGADRAGEQLERQVRNGIGRVEAAVIGLALTKKRRGTGPAGAGGKRSAGQAAGGAGTTMRLVDRPDERFGTRRGSAQGLRCRPGRRAGAAQRRHRSQEIEPRSRQDHENGQAKECPVLRDGHEGGHAARAARGQLRAGGSAQAAETDSRALHTVYRATLRCASSPPQGLAGDGGIRGTPPSCEGQQGSWNGSGNCGGPPPRARGPDPGPRAVWPAVVELAARST